MSNAADCRACYPQAAAVALGRWCLGLIFLFFGIGKLADVVGFAANLVKQFEKTWLPPLLLNIFGHVLPFWETIVGTLLILGIFRNVTLSATGVLLLVLTFGQIVLGQPQVVFFNTVYTFLAAGLLFLERYDRWVLFPRAQTAIERTQP